MASYDIKMTEPLVLVANSSDGTITSFRLSGDSLSLLSTAHGLTGCSNFVVDPVHGVVHAAVKGEPAGIVTLTLDRDSGVLTQIARRDLQGGGLNYVALTRGGSALLGVSYGGGYGITASAGSNGVGEPVTRVSYPNLHSVFPSEDGKFAYFVSLGADLVAQYDQRRTLARAAHPGHGGRTQRKRSPPPRTQPGTGRRLRAHRVFR